MVVSIEKNKHVNANENPYLIQEVRHQPRFCLNLQDNSRMVRDYLDNTFSNRWIGTRCSVEWPHHHKPQQN